MDFLAKKLIHAKITVAIRKQNASQNTKFSRKTTTNAFATTVLSAMASSAKNQDRSIPVLDLHARKTLTRQSPTQESAPVSVIKTILAMASLFVSKMSLVLDITAPRTRSAKYQSVAIRCASALMDSTAMDITASSLILARIAIKWRFAMTGFIYLIVFG